MKAAGIRNGTTPGAADWGGLSTIEPKSLGGIVAAASDITILIDAAGVVSALMINDSSRDLGNLDHWVGRSIRDFLTSESIPKFDAAVEQLEAFHGHSKAVELNHSDNAVWDFPIQYTFHPIESDGGVLMMGRDLRPIAETQRQLVQAQIALERGYEAQREFDSRYRLLLATVTDAIVLVSLGDGRVSDLNDNAADLLDQARKDVVGTVFASHFENVRRSEMETKLVNSALSEGSDPILMPTARSGQVLRIASSVFRVGSDRVVICRLVPHEDTPRMESGGMGALLESLFAKAVEGVLFTDTRGAVRNANDRFLSMVDAAHLPALKGRNLVEFLARGQVDLGVILDNVMSSGQVRLYATELISDFGSKIPVEISATLLGEGRDAHIAFVFRDSGRMDALRLPTAEGENTAQQNILELVGSASLKEIVAETNDVIEKLCIETAIKLTNNNRVAAAEMLGMSRQSLYVKLRKYDFLKKGEED
ncbi:transcriptional regulator PpsR [Meridianimarinicoccus aquatilis]|uniref:Transcriptional regulator PpsR n=1 Tax=Meridianimarinicoccus aquatilis TaxID=2552766 RepID=A0A4R6ATL2_9RHOB|nr:transcriptional regulator PpsR [Fluviibacterium aquatile]TDL86048.1 transcriptional regulator PpsR [Fluviibacterium aquatile]